MSIIFEVALAEWRRVRGDYQIWLEAQHRAASAATNGVLLNARGKARQERGELESMSLFMGPAVRAAAYASEELIEFWQRSPRITFEQFERQTSEWDEDLIDPVWAEGA